MENNINTAVIQTNSEIHTSVNDIENKIQSIELELEDRVNDLQADIDSKHSDYMNLFTEYRDFMTILAQEVINLKVKNILLSILFGVLVCVVSGYIILY